MSFIKAGRSIVFLTGKQRSGFVEKFLPNKTQTKGTSQHDSCSISRKGILQTSGFENNYFFFNLSWRRGCIHAKSTCLGIRSPCWALLLWPARHFGDLKPFFLLSPMRTIDFISVGVSSSKQALTCEEKTASEGILGTVILQLKLSIDCQMF